MDMPRGGEAPAEVDAAKRDGPAAAVVVTA
jgi:hypothetical protein